MKTFQLMGGIHDGLLIESADGFIQIGDEIYNRPLGVDEGKSFHVHTWLQVHTPDETSVHEEQEASIAWLLEIVAMLYKGFEARAACRIHPPPFCKVRHSMQHALLRADTSLYERRKSHG
jgi:hypothetical protein